MLMDLLKVRLGMDRYLIIECLHSKIFRSRITRFCVLAVFRKGTDERTIQSFEERVLRRSRKSFS